MAFCAILKETRIQMENYCNIPHKLTLKVGIQREIFNFPGFNFNKVLNRWERMEEMKLDLTNKDKIEFELYHRYDKSALPLVVGEGCFKTKVLKNLLFPEMKIALTYDKVHVGWMYFEIVLLKNNQILELKLSKPFILEIKKMQIKFLESPQKKTKFNIKIQKNQSLIYSSQCAIKKQQLNLSPNLKEEVKLSDHIVIYLESGDFKPVRSVSFLIDNIKRGQDCLFQGWILNKLKNKVGDIIVEYFLDNLYLQNYKAENPLLNQENSFRKSLFTDAVNETSTVEETKPYTKTENSTEQRHSGFKGAIIYQNLPTITPVISQQSLDNDKQIQEILAKRKQKKKKEERNSKMQFYFGSTSLIT